MNNEKIIQQLESLSDQISLIDSNLKFNITVFLGSITLFLAISGWALFLFAQSIVRKGIDKQIKSLKDELVDYINEKTPVLDTITMTVGGTVSKANAIRIQVDQLDSPSQPQVFIQPKGNPGDLEVYSVPNSFDYIVINKKQQFLSFEVLIINGNLRLGRVPVMTEKEALKLVDY